MPEKQEDPLEEAPPFFRSWNSWYALVLLTLSVLIILFYAFTKYFE